jgi:hypothetical protein
MLRRLLRPPSLPKTMLGQFIVALWPIGKESQSSTTRSLTA